uniref:Transcriptional factor B3; Auxin response factor, putative n=1 Tax=Medicago truncatula TaxID=3880 RepID=A2Q1Q7_MEDTR|nr:Transcriptional factor B3; Auxin response factor, putative [Medicago truncatula]
MHCCHSLCIPPRTKLRLPQLPNFPLDSQFSMPTFPNNLLSPNIPNFHLPETTPYQIFINFH